MSIISNYRKTAAAVLGEVNDAPSMTEDAHILSLERLVKDYTRGIVHNECFRQAYYDDGDDIVDIDVPSDLTDLYRELPSEPANTNVPSSEPDQVPSNNTKVPDGGPDE